MNRKNIKNIVKLYEAYITAEMVLHHANSNFDITKVDRNEAQANVWITHKAWADARDGEQRRITDESYAEREKRAAKKAR